MSKSSWISRLNFRGPALFLRLRERSGSPQKQIQSLGLRRGRRFSLQPRRADSFEFAKQTNGE